MTAAISGFFKKNTFQIIMAIVMLIGAAYVLRVNVNTLIEDNKTLKAEVADLKTFRQVQEGQNIYFRETLTRIDRNVERLLRRN